MLDFFIEKSSFTLSIFLLAPVMAFSLVIMTKYLNKGIGEKQESKTDDKLMRELLKVQEEVESIRISPTQKSKDILNESDKEKLIEAAKKRIIGNTLTLADKRLREEIDLFKKKLSINKTHSDMVFRLEGEIDRLNRRGGANLAIGFMMAVLGISVLAYYLYIPQVIGKNMDYVFHLLPKISFVVFIELFAFFFLRLYKNGFDEIKYFQNELTTLETKMIAVTYALNTDHKDIEKEVILSLMSTERNFILDKGQSTVFLEKERMHHDSNKQLTSIFSEILKLKIK